MGQLEAMTDSRAQFSASPLEGEVGPQVRVGGDVAAFPMPTRRLHHTPHPAAMAADLPLKGGGVNADLQDALR